MKSSRKWWDKLDYINPTKGLFVLTFTTTTSPEQLRTLHIIVHKQSFTMSRFSSQLSGYHVLVTGKSRCSFLTTLP